MSKVFTTREIMLNMLKSMNFTPFLQPFVQPRAKQTVPISVITYAAGAGIRPTVRHLPFINRTCSFNRTQQRHNVHATLLLYLLVHRTMPEFIEPENWRSIIWNYILWIIQCGECCNRRRIVTKFQTLTG